MENERENMTIEHGRTREKEETRMNDKTEEQGKG